jgi:hypothetical protein
MIKKDGQFYPVQLWLENWKCCHGLIKHVGQPYPEYILASLH